MASWMVHLRVADALLQKIPDLLETEFIVGNIAPDSGVPNEDWSAFYPSTKISHFKREGKKADPDAFAEKYFAPDQKAGYDPRQYSFYLGYLTHLITDQLWSRDVYTTTRKRFPEEFASDPQFVWTVKEDWYDLDYKYLRDHPDFHAFQVFQRAVGFSNTFMDEFASDAFDNRRAYITDFYLQGKDGLDREYPYLTEDEMNDFVEKSTLLILEELKRF